MNMKIIARRELRFCSSCASKYSLPAAKWVFSEVDNIVPKENVGRGGRSFSSSIPSRIEEPQKSYKRVSKDVRQAMVESFVKEYQSLNEGKFPKISQTQKQVGGSYYVLRSILQELEHKSTVLDPKSRSEIAREKKPYKESECLIQAVEESSSFMFVIEPTKTTSLLETIKEDTVSGVNGDKHLKANYPSQNSTPVEMTLPPMEPTPHVSGSNSTSVGHVRKRKSKKTHHTHCKLNDSTVDIILDNDVDLAATIGRPKEKEKISHPRPKIIENNKTNGPGKDSTKFEHTNNQNRQPEVSFDGAEIHRSRETSKEQTHDSDLSKESTLWGNLKSFADGIMNLWRKR